MGWKERTEDLKVRATPAFQYFHEDTAPSRAIQHSVVVRIP